jgi:uncharacterized protein YjiS (DUF1127 family)
MNRFSTIFVIIDFFGGIMTTLQTWQLHHKTSMEFARVDAHTLHDIGISIANRFIEVNKPFWEN